MINPTIGNNSQFTGPFDILPNVLYTNPTLNNSQFTGPFDTLPNRTFPNPTFKKIGIQPINYGTTTYSPYSGNPFDSVASGKVRKNPLTYNSTSSFIAVTDLWVAPAAEASNITLSSFAASVTGFAASSVASLTGIPQVSQVANSLINLSDTTLTSRYATLTFDQMRALPGVKYADFRNRRAIGNLGAASLIRLDGAAAIAAGVSAGGRITRTAIFAAASANPLGGAYGVFNLDGFGFTGYGWGSHGDTNAIRNDFTLRSHVVNRWTVTKDDNGKIISEAWAPTKNPIEVGVPFRGDRVNVIDFSQRTEKDAYKWNPRMPGQLGNTQDFIKFYFTGPKLYPGLSSGLDLLDAASEVLQGSTDDVIVFRASVTDITDSFTGEWSPVTMIGRADKNYQYTGFERDLQLSFKVHATDRDELQPIWRKLNALAGYTAPIYNTDITMGAPWMRITIGDLFRQTPVILTSLSYTLQGTDTTWEINIENADYMMQVPHTVEVKCTFTVIGNELPQKGGKMYSLAKRWDKNGVALKGNDNWLSDAKENSDAAVDRIWEIKRRSENVNLSADSNASTINNNASLNNQENTPSKIQNIIRGNSLFTDPAKPTRR